MLKRLFRKTQPKAGGNWCVEWPQTASTKAPSRVSPLLSRCCPSVVWAHSAHSAQCASAPRWHYSVYHGHHSSGFSSSDPTQSHSSPAALGESSADPQPSCATHLAFLRRSVCFLLSHCLFIPKLPCPQPKEIRKSLGELSHLRLYGSQRMTTQFSILASTSGLVAVKAGISSCPDIYTSTQFWRMLLFFSNQAIAWTTLGEHYSEDFIISENPGCENFSPKKVLKIHYSQPTVLTWTPWDRTTKNELWDLFTNCD